MVNQRKFLSNWIIILIIIHVLQETVFHSDGIVPGFSVLFAFSISFLSVRTSLMLSCFLSRRSVFAASTATAAVDATTKHD
jgi:hypothetical protein